MSNNYSNREGCAGWFKWIVGTIIGLLSAGGGIVALMSILDEPDAPKEPEQIVITIDNDDQPGGDETPVELPEDVVVPTPVPQQPPIANNPGSNRPSEQDVAQFLYEAVLAETAAYLYLDSSYVSWYFAGAPLTFMQSDIADLLEQGVLVAKLYDDRQSYIHEITFVDDFTIAVDSCEIWSREYYSLWDSSFLGSEGPSLFPQTIFIEEFTDGWFITHDEFYEPPAFCR